MTLRKNAERAALQRLTSAALREAPDNYTAHPRDNLVATVAEDDFWDDLSRGSGSELTDSDGTPAKFCAAHSSSALAVNSFGPFRHNPGRLQLAGLDKFQEFCFEKQLPTGLRGTPPNLDAFAAGDAGVVCIESKFLETLTEKTAKFSTDYAAAAERLADDAWALVYQDLVARPDKYKRLDAAQLVKHYLGMRHSLKSHAAPQVLLYAYWEPTNWASISEYRDHRREIAAFDDQVEDGGIRFVATPYHLLWSDWENSVNWSGIGTHVGLLRARYEFDIPC